MTSSFIFIGSIVISLCFFLNTLNISSANACPIVLTPLKSKNTILNFSILDKIEENKNIFPKDFKRTFNWLSDRNVMLNYKDIDFLERAFQGLAKNIRRGEILNLAVSELKKNYNLFEEKSIKEFFYVKDKSIEEFLNK